MLPYKLSMRFHLDNKSNAIGNSLKSWKHYAHVNKSLFYYHLVYQWFSKYKKFSSIRFELCVFINFEVYIVLVYPLYLKVDYIKYDLQNS